VKIRIVVAWYDFWVGAFFDRKKHALYLFPMPCFGLCIQRPAKRDGKMEAAG